MPSHSQTPSSSNKRVYNKSEGRTPRVKRGNAFDFGSFKVDLERLQSDAKIQDLKLAFYERDKPLPYWFISNDAMTASAKKLGIAREVLQGNCRLMFDLQVVVIADSIEQKLASSEEWVDTLANMITYLEFTVMRSDSFLDSRHDTVKCVSVAHGMDRTRSLK